MEYQEAFEKSLHIFQFKCTNKRCSQKVWWGSMKNQMCRNCGRQANKLDLEQTIGIGWFKCQCGRKYAGFSRGDVTSKCHGCHMENYAEFIVPGDRANQDEKKPDKQHYSNICKGDNDCPIVEEALRVNINMSVFKYY